MALKILQSVLRIKALNKMLKKKEVSKPIGKDLLEIELEDMGRISSAPSLGSSLVAS